MNPNAVLLLVEDDPNDVFLMKRALKTAKIGNPLKVAENGQEAIDYLAGLGKFANRERFPLPSLIFLDLKLPYKSGFEVLQWIRSQSFLNSTLVVVLTSSEEDRDSRKSQELGSRSFLVKPPTPAMLTTLMASLNDYWMKAAYSPLLSRPRSRE
ncbi:Response regulator receiver domain-containing protein [Verrucomicrobium sp. GAS474]|uniref:response regulator n=1 Tax=Verrucomicrobium sp. GAS474 TaxID=1882831 RepID=UPI00087A0ABE|nr:response regulator [Verrucomicrobium sp. GAS474]SDU28473.1 Response regulator receiver domain-containing protein [Verrucomicrobium sp. GAS474]